MMTGEFDDECAEIVIALARELTGSNVSKLEHGIILQNVAARLANCECNNLAEYLCYVEANPDEMSALLSAVTIHTTAWFREPGAFVELQKSLSAIDKRFNATTPFRVLSVACSTGEEVYSIASILETKRLATFGFDYFIEGWDIDPLSLRTARNGIYQQRGLADVAEQFSVQIPKIDRLDEDLFAMPAQVKDRCRFRTVNIVSPPLEDTQFDWVFCRNMLIYFDAEAVSTILKYLVTKMAPSGHLCLGVSEVGAMRLAEMRAAGAAIFTSVNQAKLIPNVQTFSAPRPRSSLSKAGPRILVVDDDRDQLDMMVDTLSAQGFACALASHGAQALALLQSQDIDLVFSDYLMQPDCNGLQLCVAARAAGYAGGFVLISGVANQKMTEKAIASGCNEVVLKPIVGDDLVRLAKFHKRSADKFVPRCPDVILIGASTGGVEVLIRMLANMPLDCPPVMVVQHISGPIAFDFASRLAKAARLVLGSMENDEVLRPGHLYIALGDYHIGLRESGGKLHLTKSSSSPINRHRPSVDFMFGAAAKTRSHIVAALMTGMGRDGAQGLLQLKQQGAETFAQDEASCVVFGMPKEAIALGAASQVLNPDDIRMQLNMRIQGQFRR